MTIGTLSAETGIPASAIRYYERIGVLPRSGRVSGQRRYDSDAVGRLAVLRLAQACGFHLDEIRLLLHGFAAETKPSARWRKLAAQKTKEIDGQLERLAVMRQLVNQVARCECADFAECGRRSIVALAGQK